MVVEPKSKVKVRKVTRSGGRFGTPGLRRSAHATATRAAVISPVFPHLPLLSGVVSVQYPLNYLLFGSTAFT